MKKKTILIVVSLTVVGVVTSFSADAKADLGPRDGANKPGLIGIQYGSEDFTDIQNLSRLSSLERAFSSKDDYGREWSGSWVGFIVAPASGKVAFSAETDQAVQMRIGSKMVIESEKGTGTGSVSMVKGKEYPIEITYVKDGPSYECYFKIQWNWAGQEKVSIPSTNLMHTAEQEQEWVRKAQEAEDDDDEDENEDIEGGADIIREILGVKDSDVAVRGTSAAERVELSKAVIVVFSKEKIQAKAAQILRDEIEKRTRIRLGIVSKMPGKDKAAIVVGTAKQLAKRSYRPGQFFAVPEKADAYAVWVDRHKRDAATVCLAGYDDRAVLYAAGRLLRELEMNRDRLELDSNLRAATAPKYPLRGHQVGYRPKTNAYDGWGIKIWEQYFRDMIAFGTNAVELIPPRSDDEADSPHFPKPKLEMMVKMSQLADDYGLDVWIWYPVVEDDDLDDSVIKEAMKEREEIFSGLPRIDAVFVPGGDPGEINPQQLFPLMKQQKKILNKYHPKAQIWVSPQGFDWDGEGIGWMKMFYDILQNEEPKWLDGIVFGPQVRDNLKLLRQNLPKRYPIRRYPDITHCLDAQYSVPDWDPAYHVTLYREPINPRPMGYAKIFRDWDEYTVGFITYSEGVNDDVNKFIWACLGWDPEMKVEDILKEYSKYFISGRYAEKFAKGLLGLERNWQGPLLTNVGVYETLKIFQAMEKDATPQEKLNWRFQLALYRAYYDAYTRRRLIYETELEEKAMDVLRNAEQLGSLSAMDKAEAILDKAEKEKVAADWRARTFEMAEALFQSIRMQLSVERYQAKSTRRGGNLDLIDVPLNDSTRIRKLFRRIRRLESERSRLAAISQITAERYLMKLKHDRDVILEGIH